MYYNLLTAARMKAVVFGSFVIGSMVAVVFVLFRTKENGNLISYPYLLLSSSVIFLLLLLAKSVPFGYRLERQGKDRVCTYFQMGPVKWNVRRIDDVRQIVIEQDHERYYRIWLVSANGNRVLLERHATLDNVATRHSAFTNFIEAPCLNLKHGT